MTKLWANMDCTPKKLVGAADKLFLTLPEASVEVTVSGATNNNCSTCDDIDGSYLFDPPHTLSLALSCLTSCGPGSWNTEAKTFCNIGGGFQFPIPAFRVGCACSNVATFEVRIVYGVLVCGSHWRFALNGTGDDLEDFCSGTPINLPYVSASDPLSLCFLNSATVTIALV